MPRVFPRILRRKGSLDFGKLRQFCLIDLREMVAAFVLFVEFHELTQPHRRLNVSHIIFVAFGGDVVTPDAAVRLARPRVFINAVEAHRAERFGERVVVRRYHAAFRRGQIFICVETEGGNVAEGTDVASLIFSRDSVRCIIN